MKITESLNKWHHIGKQHVVQISKHIAKHIVKHHKKYIIWSMWYLMTTLFFAKVFLFKVVIIKIGLVILALVGIYDWNTTFASIQSLCINDVNFIPLSTCKINFTNIKDAITYLENKVDIPNATIYDSTDYQILHETLYNYCPENQTPKTQQTIKDRINEIATGYPTSKAKKLSLLNTLFDTLKKSTVEMQETTGIIKDFCQQKYIDYTIINALKQNFAVILDQANLRSTQTSIFEIAERKDDTILWPVLDEKIAAARQIQDTQKNLSLTNDFTYNQYYKTGSYSRKISEKIVQLANIVINAHIQELEKKKILTPGDIAILSKKITVKYAPTCAKTVGGSTFEQTLAGTQRISIHLKNIMLNINVCFNYQYMQNLRKYIEQITTHELGHYVYYIRDQNPQSFERICRVNGKTSCPKSQFVSPYSQTNSQEDYAESFLHRSLGESAAKKIYTGYYYEGNYFSGFYAMQPNNTLASKFKYFTNLLYTNPI